MISAKLDLDGLKRSHSRFYTRHQVALYEQLNSAEKHGLDYAERYPRFTPRSPHGLREANEGQVVRTRSGGIVRLKNRKPHAAAIDQGARPHDIFPKRGNRLVFFWAKKNTWVRAKRVKHPGNKPYRFLFGATQAAGRFFGKRMDERMIRIARAF